MLKILLVAFVLKLQNADSLPAEPTALSGPAPSYHYNMEHLQNQININQNNVVNIEGILESAKESVKSTDNNSTEFKTSNENAKRITDNIENELNNENGEGNLVDGVEPNDAREKKRVAETVPNKSQIEEKPIRKVDTPDRKESLENENEKVDPGDVNLVKLPDKDINKKPDNKMSDDENNEHSKEERDTAKRENVQRKNKRAT